MSSFKPSKSRLQIHQQSKKDCLCCFQICKKVFCYLNSIIFQAMKCTTDLSCDTLDTHIWVCTAPEISHHYSPVFGTARVFRVQLQRYQIDVPPKSNTIHQKGHYDKLLGVKSNIEKHWNCISELVTPNTDQHYPILI